MFYLLFFILSGCCASHISDRSAVSSLVESRLEKTLTLNQEGNQTLIPNLFSQPMTAEIAVEIALLNNPELAARLHAIGIAEADLIEAGLFRNPIFECFVRWPNRHSLHLNSEFSVTQNFLDLLLIPLRKKVAAAELAETQFLVAHDVVQLAYEVQRAYVSMQAELQKQSLLQLWLEGAEAEMVLVQAQAETGNISALEMDRRMASYKVATLEISKNQILLIQLREKMNLLLGLTDWCINIPLSDIPEEEITDFPLESLALSQRLDVEAARWKVEKTLRLFGTKKAWTFTDATAGVSREKEAEGFHVTGPTFSLVHFLFLTMDKQTGCVWKRFMDSRSISWRV